jgi:hypothetical protein
MQEFQIIIIHHRGDSLCLAYTLSLQVTTRRIGRFLFLTGASARVGEVIGRPHYYTLA